MLALSFTMPPEVMAEMPWFRILQRLDPGLSAWFLLEFCVRAGAIKPWRSYVFSAKGIFCFLAALPPTAVAPIEALRHLGRFLMAASTQFFVEAVQEVLDAVKLVVTQNKKSLGNMVTLVLLSMLAGDITLGIVEQDADHAQRMGWVTNQVLPFLGIPVDFSPTTVTGQALERLLTLVRYAALTWLGALVLRTWRVAVGDPPVDSTKK